MLLISCRKDFERPREFGPHSFWPGGYSPIKPFPEILAIHGYHTSSDSAQDSYAGLQKGLAKEIAGYLWPGGDLFVSYPLAVGRAQEAGWRLRDLFLGWDAVDLPLDLQTHSLGARVAMEAIKYGGFKVRNLILSAPAVFADCFAPGGEFADVPKWCKTISVAYSNDDGVLAKSFPLGQFPNPTPALGLVGGLLSLAPPNVRFRDFTGIVKDHGGYRYSAEYFKFWKELYAD